MSYTNHPYQVSPVARVSLRKPHVPVTADDGGFVRPEVEQLIRTSDEYDHSKKLLWLLRGQKWSEPRVIVVAGRRFGEPLPTICPIRVPFEPVSLDGFDNRIVDLCNCELPPNVPSMAFSGWQSFCAHYFRWTPVLFLIAAAALWIDGFRIVGVWIALLTLAAWVFWIFVLPCRWRISPGVLTVEQEGRVVSIDTHDSTLAVFESLGGWRATVSSAQGSWRMLLSRNEVYLLCRTWIS